MREEGEVAIIVMLADEGIRNEASFNESISLSHSVVSHQCFSGFVSISMSSNPFFILAPVFCVLVSE
jgi:hypothetical protein